MIEYQTWLADALREEGLDPIEEPYWKTRSQPTTRDYAPIAVLNHHTAPPVPFPVNRLYTKCNLNIKPDGTVHVVAAGYQYDSGLGSSEVLNLVKNDLPLPPEDLEAWKSNINGNPYFIDIEVDHLGDGSPIPEVQLEALIKCNVAICRYKGWDPMTKVIGHLEWAPDRKIDPRWNGFANQMPSIREATAQGLLEEEMTPEEKAALEWVIENRDWLNTFIVSTTDGVANKDPEGGPSGPTFPEALIPYHRNGRKDYQDKVNSNANRIKALEDHPDGGSAPDLKVTTETVEIVTAVEYQ